MFPNIGGKTPKWMVKIMETPIKIDDLGVPLFWKHPFVNPLKMTPTLSSSKHRLEKHLQQQAANPAHEPILAVPLSFCMDVYIDMYICINTSSNIYM